MNKLGYFAIGFAAGLGIGLTVAMIIKTRDKIEHEEEIESVKAAYREAFGTVTAKEDNMKPHERQAMKDHEKSEALREANRHINYNKYATLVRDDPVREHIVPGNEYEPPKPTSEEEAALEDKMAEEEEHPSEGYPQPPQPISPEEYSMEPAYSKVDLEYYVISDTLVDEHGVEVDDVDRLIGYNNLRHMGEYEPGCLWIRDYNTMTDYQIVSVPSAWNG